MKPEGSLPYTQEPVICPYPDRSSPCRHPISRRSILISPSHLRLGLPSGLRPSGFSTKILYAPLSPPYVLHAPPITVFLTWSPIWYLVRNTEHKARCYAVFSTPLLPHPSEAQISSSALYSPNPSVNIPPSMWVTSFTPIQNNRQSYTFVYLNLYVFGESTGRQNILHWMTASIPSFHSALNLFILLPTCCLHSVGIFFTTCVLSLMYVMSSFFISRFEKCYNSRSEILPKYLYEQRRPNIGRVISSPE